MRKIITKILLCISVTVFCVFTVLLFALNEPLVFSINRAVNYLHQQGEGVPKELAGALLESGLVSDWANPTGEDKKSIYYPLLLSTASPLSQYPYQSYSKEGKPEGLHLGNFNPPSRATIVSVSTSKDILQAIGNAKPGDIITVSPGDYSIRSRSISISSAGSKIAPIYLRSQIFGTVTIRMDTLEGFHVIAPYWVFENLRIYGACANNNYCEHAFHVTSKGESFTLRNTEVVNFNAHVKVNPARIDSQIYYPEFGLIEYNSFYNEFPRTTSNPVTLLNINSADGWVVRGNYLADFSKDGGDQVSYGAFMKGNSRSGLFERNLVMCEHRLPADAGIRIGLSFGGGGTKSLFCKEQNCDVEHQDGVMRNNIIANCSRDVGIYLNRAANTALYNNLLYNNLGIDIRFESSSATIDSNIISGRIRERDGGSSLSHNNVIAKNCLGATLKTCPLNNIYVAPKDGNFKPINNKTPAWNKANKTNPLSGRDFCGGPVPKLVYPGPIQYPNRSDCLAGQKRAD